MEILIILGIGFVFWLFTSKTKKQDMSNAAKGISKSIQVIENTLDRANTVSLKLIFESKLKDYENSNPIFNEITFRKFCSDRSDINELVEAEILKRKIEHDRLVELNRITEVVRQINEASQLKKEENIVKNSPKNTKSEMTPEQVKQEKFRRIDESILERKKAEKKQKEIDTLNNQEINVRKHIINNERTLLPKEIKKKIVESQTPIEPNLVFDQSKKTNSDDSNIFFSTSKLGRVFGIKAKPDLFDYLLKLN